MATIPLTNSTKIAARISAVGLQLRIDHAPSGPGNALDEAISAASEEVAYYLTRFDQSTLDQSEWVKSVATDVAIYYLCRWRLNNIPESIKSQYEKWIRDLEFVMAGKNIPAGLKGPACAPGVTLQRTDYSRIPSLRTVQNGTTIRPDWGVNYTDPTEPGAR